MPSHSLIIDALTDEVRIALVDDDSENLIDLTITRPSQGRQAGDVILARVKTVVNGIRGAFVDIGDERDGFLPFPDKAQTPPVHEGEIIVVQVRHAAMAEKGAGLTTTVNLQGRYCVFMPNQHGITVSRKVTDQRLRDLFRDAAKGVVDGKGAAIVRTLALQRGEDALSIMERELQGLVQQWQGAVSLREKSSAPMCLINTADPISKAINELADTNISRLIIEGSETFARIRQVLIERDDDLQHILKRHDSPALIFEAYGVEEQLDAALSPRVLLAGGGQLYLVQTPACFSIDVDSGTASGGSAKKAMIEHINTQAAQTIARELRVRNVSGNIIVDFISNPDRKAGRALLDHLKAHVETDPVPVEILGFSRLGFVEVIRRKRDQSLSDRLCSKVGEKTDITLGYEALRCAYGVARAMPGRPVTIKAPGDVARILNADLKAQFELCGQNLGIKIDVMLSETLEVFSQGW